MSKHLKKPKSPESHRVRRKSGPKRKNQRKIDDQVYLVEIGKIQRFYIENRKVLAETASQTYSIDLRLYQVLKLLPSNFIQISQSEIINIDSISHLKLTPNGLVEIFLKNESFTYSSRRYLKTIKEKLEL